MSNNLYTIPESDDVTSSYAMDIDGPPTLSLSSVSEEVLDNDAMAPTSNNSNSNVLSRIPASTTTNTTYTETTPTDDTTCTTTPSPKAKVSIQPKITDTSTFDTYHDLFVAVEGVRESSGMRKSNLKRSTAASFTEEEGEAIFGTPMYDPGDKTKYKFPRRGVFSCNHKTGKNGASTCTLHIPFSYHTSHAHYKIAGTLSKPLCLTHNHEMFGIVVDGCVYIDSEHDLTPHEVESIHTLAIANSEMSKVKEALSVKYPKRDFSSALLHRVMDKKRTMMFGKDRHQMKEVMAHGSKAAANGGVFMPIICPETTRFAGCHYQTQRMRLYAMRYGSYFATADGTHLTNMYQFINVPWVTKDCLGKGHVAGLGLFLSENFHDITQGARLFGMSRKMEDDDNDSIIINADDNDDEQSEAAEVSALHIILFHYSKNAYTHIIHNQ